MQEQAITHRVADSSFLSFNVADRAMDFQIRGNRRILFLLFGRRSTLPLVVFMAPPAIRRMYRCIDTRLRTRRWRLERFGQDRFRIHR